MWIETDFEVYKAIMLRRSSEEVTENDVLRELFDLEPSRNGSAEVPADKSPWSPASGVEFPHDTEFRARYKGNIHYGRVDDGALLLDDERFAGERFTSPSGAAGAITGGFTNGWNFWQCRIPGEKDWKPIKLYRK